MSTLDIQPFSCTFTEGFAELLYKLKCSLALTTYQAGKLIFLSSDENGRVRQLPRDFKRAMGLAVENNRMAIATESELVILANAPALANTYPNKPAFYDQFYVPRAAYYTGAIDLHDIGWDKDGNLWGVNTLFSSLVQITDRFSFEPKWTPPFINNLEPEDYCHLNGMAMVDGYPKYVTMFGQTNSPKGWRQNVETGGVIMDINKNTVVASNLQMPHSPRWINGKLYCLLSATGELVTINLHTGLFEVVSRHNGFVRGLAHYDDYLFVGLSKNRQKTSVERHLPVGTKVMECGVDIVQLSTASVVASARYQSTAEEIYDIQVLPFTTRPGILNNSSPIHQKALHTSSACFWAKE